MAPARILIIAGSDSGGGAGIQADIKTVTMLGGFAMTAVTALTAQNTLGVQAVAISTPDMVRAQIDSVAGDLGVDAVKLGMLGSPEIADTVADWLQGQAVPVVFDPVMVATSGAALADAATIAAFERLVPLASVVTPNLPELEALGGLERLMKDAQAVLVKGGHAEGAAITDTLHQRGARAVQWTDARIDTRHTHGTGCTLASAIATGLGQGMTLADATTRARQFVRAALEAAPGFGGGAGPMGHQAVRLP